MKIEFSRTGGVAGVHLRGTFDTDELPAEQADRLRRLVSAAAALDQPSVLTSSTSSGADRFQYRVTITDGDRIKTVEMGESSIPRTLQPLLDYLTDLARIARKLKRS